MGIASFRTSSEDRKKKGKKNKKRALFLLEQISIGVRKTKSGELDRKGLRQVVAPRTQCWLVYSPRMTCTRAVLFLRKNQSAIPVLCSTRANPMSCALKRRHDRESAYPVYSSSSESGIVFSKVS
ncbi:hypothetical protein AVEN_202139-1 [Araneus ventricosus]|uniref:Uncharacterized protein n=1 Tax=Araneus ventricosus TaxID=182803 RepID=A0A4Y2E3J7_ARAVE|nr:hypothetical protein AVEN_202139-1 [Araneus ventricosus]